MYHGLTSLDSLAFPQASICIFLRGLVGNNRQYLGCVVSKLECLFRLMNRRKGVETLRSSSHSISTGDLDQIFVQ